MPNAAARAAKAGAQHRAGTALAQSVLLALAMALPLVAQPASLSHLLSLPLEQLLELQIGGPAPPWAPWLGCTP